MGPAATSCDYESNNNDVTVMEKPKILEKHGKTHALSTALSEERAQSFPIHSIIKRDKRARHTIPYFPTVLSTSVVM